MGFALKSTQANLNLFCGTLIETVNQFCVIDHILTFFEFKIGFQVWQTSLKLGLLENNR